MQTLTNLFKLIELTRDQPQYGYALSGFAKGEQSDLAQHHYLVTFIAWQIVLNLKTAGAKINLERALEMTLVHDLGELFGGDLSFYYARLRPAARKAAKDFQKENEKFIAKFFADDGVHFKKLMTEESAHKKTDESLIVEVADHIEAMQFKHARGKLSKQDITANGGEIVALAEKFTNPVAKREMQKFLKAWHKNFYKESLLAMISEMNK